MGREHRKVWDCYTSLDSCLLFFNDGLGEGENRGKCETVTLAFTPVSLFFYDGLEGGRDGERTEKNVGLLHKPSPQSLCWI